MAASGTIVDAPLAAAAALNAVSLPSAEASYALMVEVLKNDASPLIFGSLSLSASAIARGLAAYEATEKRRWPKAVADSEGDGHATP